MASVDVITSQPNTGNSTSTEACFNFTSGPITVRNLANTPEDSIFAGCLIVEALKGKFIHATSESSLSKVKEYLSKYHEDQLPVFYQHTFVVEYYGERAGLLKLWFHDDPAESSRSEYNTLGCCDSIGLNLYFSCLSENVAEGKCCLDHICVDEKFRGKGIGKVLLDVADNEAIKRGCHTIYLWVTSTNRARNLYERQGYTIQTTKTLCCCGLWCIIGERAMYRMDKLL